MSIIKNIVKHCKIKKLLKLKKDPVYIACKAKYHTLNEAGREYYECYTDYAEDYICFVMNGKHKNYPPFPFRLWYKYFDTARWKGHHTKDYNSIE